MVKMSFPYKLITAFFFNQEINGISCLTLKKQELQAIDGLHHGERHCNMYFR